MKNKGSSSEKLEQKAVREGNCLLSKKNSPVILKLWNPIQVNSVL